MPADLDYPHIAFFFMYSEISILSGTYHHEAMVIQAAIV